MEEGTPEEAVEGEQKITEIVAGAVENPGEGSKVVVRSGPRIRHTPRKYQVPPNPF